MPILAHIINSGASVGMWTWGLGTLSQPGRADHAYPIVVSTPSFESHRRACNYDAK